MRRAAAVPILGACPPRTSRSARSDLRALARRAALPAAAAAACVIAVVVLGGPLQAFADALAARVDADPRWVARRRGLRAALVRRLHRPAVAGRQPRAPSASACARPPQITLGGAAATRLLPTAGAGGAALTLWSLRRSGLGTRGATRHAAGVPRRSCTRSSSARSRVAGALLALGLAGGRAARAERAARRAWPRSAWPAARWPPAWRPPAAGTGPRCACARRRRARRRRPRRGRPRALGRPAAARRARLVGVRHGRPVGDAATPSARRRAFAVVVLAYFVGQVGNTIPIPGAVSGGMVGVLVAFGVAGRPRDRLRARLPRDRDLAAGADRARRPRQAAPHDRALGPRGRAGPPPAASRRARSARRARPRPARAALLAAGRALPRRGMTRRARGAASRSPRSRPRRFALTAPASSDARPREGAHRPLRHARHVDLRAGRRARVPGDGRVRRPRRAGRDRGRARRRRGRAAAASTSRRCC